MTEQNLHYLVYNPIKDPKICVIIPAYKVIEQIKDVIFSVSENKLVDYTIVVDDKCPYFSGKEIETLNQKNIIVIYNEINKGVGGAVIEGYKKARHVWQIWNSR